MVPPAWISSLLTHSQPWILELSSRMPSLQACLKCAGELRCALEGGKEAPTPSSLSPGPAYWPVSRMALKMKM